MGRLFWKFFLSILLAQVVATIGIAGTLWLRDQTRQRGTEPTLDAGPPAAIMMEAAAATLKLAGADGLRELATSAKRTRLYVLDEQGHEILGRPVSAKLREEVERNLQEESPTRAVARLTGPDGRRYLVFASRVWRGSLPLSAALEAASGVGAGRVGRGPEPSGPAPSGPGPSDHGPAGHGEAGHGPAGPGPNPGSPPGAAPGPGPGAPGTDNPWANGRGPGDPGMDGPFRGPGNGVFGFAPEFGHHVSRWLPIVAAVLASLLFAALLAWYFSRPIRALRNAFEAAAAGDLAPKFGASKPGVAGDELAELGHDFDRMSAQLRNLMEGQRRLLHDVSHELRSPLARLQAAIGLAHQQPERLQASLERIERESVRMDRLVGELLTLSRLEAATAPPQVEAVDLVEMVDQIADDARFEAGAQIDVAAPVPIAVRGAPDLLWSAVENIVRNAVKHGGADNKVDIALRPDGALVHIDVQDQGPGIAPEHLGDIFEPFFRSNPTQNNVDGHGLGLAIAKRVVDNHGGSITAVNRAEGGLRVTITLPREA